MISFDEINNWHSIMASGCAIYLDYGNRRTGVAISDASWTIATPLTVLETTDVLNGLLKILKEYRISLIVIGIPLALNGGMHGQQHEIVNNFSENLQAFLNKNNFAIPIMQYDERLSTVAANRVLADAELSIKGKKKRVDKVAASFVLQGILDRVKYKVYED